MTRLIKLLRKIGHRYCLRRDLVGWLIVKYAMNTPWLTANIRMEFMGLVQFLTVRRRGGTAMPV